MILQNLDEIGVDYFVILEEKKKLQNVKRGILSAFLSHLKFKKGKYKTIPTFSPYRFIFLLKELTFKRSRFYLETNQTVSSYNYNFEKLLIVEDINGTEVVDFLKTNQFDYCLFAGVGIVKGNIIDLFGKMCLNAHPAPLPECRGGGALENTLLQRLNPSLSVHIATAGIDEGGILVVEKISLTKHDTFESINFKLTLKCAEVIVRVTKKILDEEKIDIKLNGGDLNFWKDMTLKKQLKARRILNQGLKKIVS